MTRLTRVASDDLHALHEGLEAVTGQCHEGLQRECVPPEDRMITLSLDMRYVRQNFELEVALETMMESPKDMDQALRTFHNLHERNYGQSNEDAPVEVVNIKARGTARMPRPQLKELPSGSADSSKANVGSRRVFFKGMGWVDCPSYDREQLLAGNRIEGPAMINEFDSSIVLLPGHRCTIDRFGDIMVDASGNGS